MLSEHERWTALVCHAFVAVQLFFRHEQWRVLALAVGRGGQWLSEHGLLTIWALDGVWELRRICLGKCQFEVK